MNILTDTFPTAIEIDGKEYEINTDFRACLRIIMAFEDDELTTLEKRMVLLENLYPEKPADLQTAYELGIRFINSGKDEDNEESAPPIRLFSFSKDANFIFAAFRQTHGIDLETAEMHWWKFLALFMDLGQDTTFCNLVGLRKRIKTGRATKEERRAAREMGDLFEVPEPDTRTLEEKDQEAEFLRLIEEGRKKNARK